MLVICYYDNQNQKQFTDGYQTMESFEQQNQNCKIAYVFDKDNDLIQLENSRIYLFNRYCAMYGFEPSDYNQTFEGKYQLIGFAPNRKKYKCLVYNRNNKKTYCMAPERVHKSMQSNP